MTLVRQEETRSKTGTGSSLPAANIGYWNGSPKHILSMTINMVGEGLVMLWGKKSLLFLYQWCAYVWIIIRRIVEKDIDCQTA